MTIDQINDLDRGAFVLAVGWIFEHSPWVAERSWEHRPFASLEKLSQTMESAVESSSHAEQLALLGAHPALGSRAQMSQPSTDEQASAGLDRLTLDEYQRFHRLNEAYKTKFGFPFLFAVKGSNKSQILDALERRLDAGVEEEFQTAMRQVYKIARFRLQDLIDNQR
ncbi:MAG: 2-oxo-4-hydroxy-4-carboxy-5-ureidoimidazoline decarboxylase [Bryobacteraceae bacterium]